MEGGIGQVPGADAFGRLSRKAAADALGYSPGTLANWATSGFGPRVYKSRTGGKVYYLADDIRAFALDGVAAA